MMGVFQRKAVKSRGHAIDCSTFSSGLQLQGQGCVTMGTSAFQGFEVKV